MTEAEVREFAGRLAGEPVAGVEQVARSSNRVFRVTTVAGARYSLRVPLLRPDRLSAFWQQLRDTFGLRYGTQLGQVHQLAEQIRRDGILTAPTPVASGGFDGTTAYLFTWVDGDRWEPDEFPDSADVHQQLGSYLAHLHTQRLDGFGTLDHQPYDRRELIARANASMATIVNSYWTHRPDVVEFFEHQIAKAAPDGLAEHHPAPIMPDVSGNQFVYRDAERIVGVVDLDSYVAGPRELELATAELCLTRPEDFRCGYEEILPLPRFEPFRTYWRFWLMINDLDWAPDLTEFLTARTYFD